MRRLLALFLLVVLPLSWTASAVAAYCKHETTAAEQNHMGHHDHQHEADGVAGGVGANTSTPTDPVQSGGSDPDCGACQAGGVCPPSGVATRHWMVTASVGFADYREMLEHSLFERPERPQWRVLA